MPGPFVWTPFQDFRPDFGSRLSGSVWGELILYPGHCLTLDDTDLNFDLPRVGNMDPMQWHPVKFKPLILTLRIATGSGLKLST